MCALYSLDGIKLSNLLSLRFKLQSNGLYPTKLVGFFVARFLHKIQGNMHPNVQIQFTSFHILKPYFMKKLQDFNNCCKYHQEMVEMKVWFNNMRVFSTYWLAWLCLHVGCLSLHANLISGPFWQGIVNCQTMFHVFEKNSDLWQKTLCPKVLGHKWFNLDCVKGKCLIVVSIFYQFTLGKQIQLMKVWCLGSVSKKSL